MGAGRAVLIAVVVLAAGAGVGALCWRAAAPTDLTARADVEVLALTQHLASVVAREGGQGDPAQAAEVLRRLAAELQVDLALRDGAGQIATSVGAEQGPLSPGEEMALRAGQVVRVGAPWPPRAAAPVLWQGRPPGSLIVQLASAPASSPVVPLALAGLVALIAAVLCAFLAAGSGSALRRLNGSLEELEALPRTELLDVRADRSLAPVAERINHLLQRAAAAAERDEELLAIVARELRRPVKNARQTLTKMASGEPFAHGPTALDEDLEALESILEDVLTTARLKLDRMVLRRRRTRLGVLVREAAASVASTNPVTFEVDPELAEVDVDGRLLSRAISEIVINAAQHSDAGASIAIRAVNAGELVQVQISDGGGGITPEDRERLFEPFYKSHSRRRNLPGRTGLGLTLARRVIEAHGGSISVDSELEVGTIVTISLPRAVGEPPEERPSLDRLSRDSFSRETDA